MPHAYTRLRQLLLSLFGHNVEHLRTFISDLPDGLRLNTRLRDDDADTFTRKLIDTLRSGGRLDARFFDALATRYDLHRDEIHEVACALGVGRSDDGCGFSVAIVSNSRLATHREAVAVALDAIPRLTVHRVCAEASEVESVEASDVVVVLLGWSPAGQVVLEHAASLEGALIFGAAAPQPEEMADMSALMQAQALQSTFGLIGNKERTFKSSSEAVTLARPEVEQWIRDHRPAESASVIIEGWERAYLTKRSPVWEAGHMRHLHKLARKQEKRSNVYVPLRIADSIPWQDPESGELHWTPWEGSPSDSSLEAIARFERYGKRNNSPHIERVLCQPRCRRLIIEGAAGSGKTALLQQVAHTLAALHLSAEVPDHHLDLDALHTDTEIRPIPIFLLARGLAEQIKVSRRRGRQLGLADLVAAMVDEVAAATSTRPDAAALSEGLHSGRYLILLDSLDEVPDAADRVEVVTVLRSAVGCRVVLTTRPTLETASDRNDELPLLHLAELDWEGIAALVEKWRQALQREDGYCEDFLGALQELEGRHKLPLRNPLLLTATVLVYDSRGQQLPEDSAELYDQIVEALCSTTRRSELTAQTKRQALQALFEGFLRKGEGTEWTEQAAAEWLVESQGMVFPDLKAAKRGLDDLSNDTGLLHYETRKQGRKWVQVIRPEHKTFLEFLAAAQLAEFDGSVADLTKTLIDEGRYTDPSWQKTLRFLPGALALKIATKATDHLKALLGTLPTDTDTALTRDEVTLLALAADSLAEYRHRFENSPLIAQVIEAVNKRFAARGASWPLEARLQALDALGRLGDPRLKTDPWVTIPAGSFWMGGDGAAIFSALGHRRTMPAVVMCWHPVTVSDFEPFVTGGGYREDDWWRGTPAATREEVGTEPALWSRQRHHPNRPVIGVSWHEARAYCRWASRHCRKHWHLTKGQLIDLPTEAEWEYAARGPSEAEQGRSYPWGEDDPVQGDAAQAAFGGHAGEGPGYATPVGAYPRGSRTGLCDLAGNVWEWCLDDADNWAFVDNGDQFVDTLRVEGADVSTVVDTVSSKAVRGGSWDYHPGNLRCASRGWHGPEHRRDLLGFRVVLRLSSEHTGV